MRSTPKVIFFDAAGTLIHLPRGVGHEYALVGHRLGLPLDATALDQAFAAAWRKMPARPATAGPREDDDRGWWRELVDHVLTETAPATKELDRSAFFEAAYAHFAEPGVWDLYPEVEEVLEKLARRFPLAIISNFDGRLRAVLDHLGIARYFTSVVISSEVGADKPDSLIFRRALELHQCAASEALHVGDDPVRDWQGATATGIPIFKLERPRNSLRDLLSACAL